MTFYKWLQMHRDEDTAFGDLARDLRTDMRMGCLQDKAMAKMRDHMIDRHQPDAAAVDTFAEAWAAFRHRADPVA